MVILSFGGKHCRTSLRSTKYNSFLSKSQIYNGFKPSYESASYLLMQIHYFKNCQIIVGRDAILVVKIWYTLYFFKGGKRESSLIPTKSYYFDLEPNVNNILCNYASSTHLLIQINFAKVAYNWESICNSCGEALSYLSCCSGGDLQNLTHNCRIDWCDLKPNIKIALYLRISLPIIFLYKLHSPKSPNNWGRRFNSCEEALTYIRFAEMYLQNLTHNYLKEFLLI